jgi:FtsP/CotA-like multicopper oxidase with cupredoxin domain
MNMHYDLPPSPVSAAGVRRLLAGTVLLAACASGGGTAGTEAPPALGGGGTAADSVAFPEPIVISTGANGILDVTLRVDTATLNVPGAGRQLLRAWTLVKANGRDYDSTSFPGPTFVVSPGDSVRILLVNNLPQDTTNDQCMSYRPVQLGIDHYQDCFHGPNWTNIHYHGFHVTPGEPGDDVLLEIAPHTSYQYAFRIPHNQSPGTHWYHPHKHGSVALQVSNGMSGAFIVRGGALDSLTARLGMREHLIAVQKVDSSLNLIDSTFVGQTLVNGAQTPTITMRVNEVQRWRIVNENITKTTNFQIGFINRGGVDEPTLYDVARDGVQYAPANYDTLHSDTALLMAPGNRLDVFVRAPATPGLHRLAVRSVVNRGTRIPRHHPERATRTPSDTLFYVRVVDDRVAVNTTLPATLPALPPFLQNLAGPLDSARIDYARLPVIVFADTFPQDTLGFDPPVRTIRNPGRFYLGTATNPWMRFNDSVVYIPQLANGTRAPMLLDSMQTWMVENRGLATNHPFHIHINPFQVVHVVYPQGRADPNADLYAQMNDASHRGRSPIWLDVVPLPLPRVDTLVADTVAGGRVRLVRGDTVFGHVIIRQAYEDFTGKYVMHCHILGHEERGMMQVLQVYRSRDSIPGTGVVTAPSQGSHGNHATEHAHGTTPPAPARGSGQGGGRGSGGGGHRH